jgi:hypothetical protein
MSDDDLAVVRGYREAAKRQDLEAELSFFAPHIEGIRRGRTIRGIEALQGSSRVHERLRALPVTTA